MTVQSPTRTTQPDPPGAAAIVQRTPLPPRSGWRRRLTKLDEKAAPYAYVSPFFILFGIVGLFPLLYTAWVSLHKWSLIGGQGDFVGLKNYADVLAQPYFWNALKNTVSIFLLSSVPQVIAALLIAAALDSGLRARTFWRMGVLLPYVVAPVAVALIFSDLFGDKFGLVNHLLGLVGIDPIQWHKEVLPSHVAISTMGGLQIFDEPRMYDQYGLGGADRQWQTLTLYLYQLGWTQKNFGRAAAVVWMLFLIVIVFAVVNFLVTRRIASKGQR